MRLAGRSDVLKGIFMNETVGQRIKRLRLARGMVRQSQLSELCNITQSTLSSIESKDMGFSALTLYAFAGALNVSPNVIMFGELE